MDDYLEKTSAALCSRHIKGLFAEDIHEANRKILDLIPQDALVGIGDSTGIRQLGVLQALEGRGTRILTPSFPRKQRSTAEISGSGGRGLIGKRPSAMFS